MTAALEGGKWLAARPGRTLPPRKTQYPFRRRLGGPHGWSGRSENLVPTRIWSQAIQPVVSHYTDWATRPTRFYTSWPCDFFESLVHGSIFITRRGVYMYSEFRYTAAELLFNVPWFKFLAVVVLSCSDGMAAVPSIIQSFKGHFFY